MHRPLHTPTLSKPELPTLAQSNIINHSRPKSSSRSSVKIDCTRAWDEISGFKILRYGFVLVIDGGMVFGLGVSGIWGMGGRELWEEGWGWGMRCEI